jgi:hypothetical protein
MSRGNTDLLLYTYCILYYMSLFVLYTRVFSVLAISVSSVLVAATASTIQPVQSTSVATAGAPKSILATCHLWQAKRESKCKLIGTMYKNQTPEQFARNLTYHNCRKVTGRTGTNTVFECRDQNRSATGGTAWYTFKCNTGGQLSDNDRITQLQYSRTTQVRDVKQYCVEDDRLRGMQVACAQVGTGLGYGTQRESEQAPTCRNGVTIVPNLFENVSDYKTKLAQAGIACFKVFNSEVVSKDTNVSGSSPLTGLEGATAQRVAFCTDDGPKLLALYEQNEKIVTNNETKKDTAIDQILTSQATDLATSELYTTPPSFTSNAEPEPVFGAYQSGYDKLGSGDKVYWGAHQKEFMAIMQAGGTVSESTFGRYVVLPPSISGLEGISVRYNDINFVYSYMNEGERMYLVEPIYGSSQETYKAVYTERQCTPNCYELRSQPIHEEATARLRTSF